MLHQRSRLQPVSNPSLSRYDASERGAIMRRQESLGVIGSAADVRVMISAGFYWVYSELGPAFERASGNHLITTRGPSMGDSPEAIPTRLARGELGPD